MKLHIPKTHLPKAKEIKRAWHLLDAKDISLGRLASKAAFLLIGKHRRDYTSHLDLGDFVVVINAKKIKITGNKLEGKIYHRYTGYLGHLKNIKLQEKFEKDPQWVIKKAVKGMIPANRLRPQRLCRLKVFVDEKHPYINKFQISNHKSQINSKFK
ncbi:MAG: 50S ribosomal protein L13 [Patescibacteria group bacterium]